MVMYRNECCGCAVPGYPCLGDLCSLRRVPYWACDDCGALSDDVDIYDFDGKDLCLDCVADRLKKVSD